MSGQKIPATPRADAADTQRLPQLKGVQEAAEFWDTHSVADYEDQLEVITDVRFVRAEPKRAITVRLGEGTLAALTREARELGVGPSTLARMMIIESLHGRRRGGSR